MTIGTACFATNQLANVRIFLLRHNTRARAVSIIKFNKIELIGRPQDQLFAKTTQVHHH